MKKIFILARKEFFSYFESPLGYLVVALFPALACALFLLVTNALFSVNNASLLGFFSNMPIICALLCPAMTMKVWAEEFRAGTDECLLTLPITVFQLVVGKFFGVFSVFVFALACSIALPIGVASLGDLDWGPVWGGYFATMVLGASSIAISCFISAVSSSQIIAWLLSMSFLLTINLLHLVSGASFFPVWLIEFFGAIDFSQHFEPMSRGMIDVFSLTFYLAFVVFFLSANIYLIKRRRRA